jgi:hypothetical protein
MLRVEVPAEAVIVTEVALNDCQFKVTLCPLLIVFVLAENVMVGAGALGLELLAQDERNHKAKTRAPQQMQRRVRELMRKRLIPQHRMVRQSDARAV